MSSDAHPDDGFERTDSAAGPLLARLSRPLSPTRTRIAVVADPHVTPTASGTWKAYHRTETRLRTAVAAADDAEADLTVFLGDLTRDGRPEEFACADEVLGEFDGEWVAVPGNHDVPKAWDDYETPPVSEFADRYAAETLPFRVRAGDVDVFGLDSASGDGELDESHEGLIPDAHLEWLDESLADAETPVVALHHNLFHPREHTGPFADGDFYQLRNAEALLELLSERGVPLVLSGHIHWPATARKRGVREVIAPATCSYPQAMLLVDVGPSGTDVRMVPLSGPNGRAEAYELARDGNAHGRSIAAHAADGALSESNVPFADERERARSGENDAEPTPANRRTRPDYDDVPEGIRWR
ncbi:metallophosphoesterase family protein [Halopelagius longus]|uniref:3',5'-cyclic AMP phosphodiesterase CpdA n=1 Tax=Halopelagius longus TaxID=1236180 RepID=A0A1H1BTD9_9EURY|nr:metallophosphoesterase [Halopelagius longus]RDI70910.1 serine/threonine protein phosphatase [Halopelagius longus]SDQ55030.1 3',5'-cyclic AMP phosphodiesterase CpdA [Halopelagius longus]